MHKSASSLSLSQKLRSESSRVGVVSRQSDKDNEKNNQRGNSYYGKTLPTINSSISRIEMSKSLPEPFEHLSPAFRRNTMNRLAGLSDNVNSSGLFSENHSAKTISPLCVRCGVLAALCMSCAEQDTEDALTFYRKTRAAGAATLFNKAFIEAGFRKTLKFLVFRLLKNSVQAKIRERMKKKTIVEKLFGTNLVYLPFNAWRRYTKENIVRRKNRSIEQLTSQIEVLETQIRKLSVNLTEVNRENEQLKATIAKQKSIIEAQTEKIALLEDDNKHQRERVKGLSHLVIPLINYSNALESITQQKIVETNRYLQKAATLTTSYNYNHLFEESLFEQLYHKVNNEKKRKETYAPKLTNINLPSKQLQTGHQIALTWLNSISLQAGEYIESASGQSLNRYLPQHNPAETINDLRNGKLLCRVIVTLIFDRYQLRKQAENGIININSCYYQLWNKNIITLEDIEKIRSLQSHTLELIQFLISLTVIYLEMPAFKAMEIFSGKTDVIYSFVVCLMNASIPMVNKAEKDYFEKKISIYYQIVNQIEELKQEKVASLTTVFHDEKKLLKEKEKEKEFNPLPSQPFTPTPLATTTITEGGESKDEEEDEKEEKDKIEAKESILEEGEGDGEESVEIKAKSLLEQLYEFFVYENSLKASQLQLERQEQFQKAISASESIDDVGRNDAKVVSDTTITQKEVTLDSASDSSRNVSSSHNKSSKPQDLKLDSVDRAESIDPKTLQSERRSNPLDDTDETTSLSALMATRLPKVHYSLDMSNESYDQLCKLLDEFIVSPESSRILEISEKSFVISEKLAELQSAITLIRDHRDEGIRLTTDIRQFVVTHAMKLTYRNTES